MEGIGQIGKIPFEVSSDKVTTVSGASRSYSARRSEIAYINKKPKTVYNGKPRGTGRYTIKLISSMGADVDETIEKLEDYLKKGTNLTLVIGGKPEFDGKVYISSLEVADSYFDGNGVRVAATCNISVEEA